jgi:hypothetical protein
VGRAAGRQPHRLAASTHRDPYLRRRPARAWRPRRPGHDRHPAAPVDPRPRPTHPSRGHAHPAPITGDGLLAEVLARIRAPPVAP